MKLATTFRTIVFIGSLLAFSFALAGFRKSNVMSAEDIMTRVRSAHSSATEMERIRMTIVDEEGGSQQRELVSFIKTDDSGRSRYLLRFLSPDSIRNVSLLTVETDKGGVEQYLYLPAMGRATRVTGNARAGYFMGSDFTFDDLRKEDPRQHQYHRLLDDFVDGRAVFVVMSAPADVDIFHATGYEHRLLYVDKKSFDILKVEFYERENQDPVKSFQGYDFEGVEVDGNANRPGRIVMNNHSKGTTSILTLLQARLNVELPDALFDPDSLADISDEIVGELLGAQKMEF